GFDSPVLIGFQTWRGSGFSEWNDMVIHQVLIVAGRPGIEFAFRNFLAVAAWYRHSIPMGSKIYQIKEFSTDGKKLSRCFIVLGLEDEQKWAVLVHDAALFSPR